MEIARALPFRFHRTAPIVLLFLAMTATGLKAEQVRVVQRQGALHGLLILKDANGKTIAVGDQTYQVRRNTVSSRTTFHFRDGSLDDEETTFRQGETFHLIRDHHIQKGPSFTRPAEVTIEAARGEVSWTDLSKNGNQAESQRMKLPADLANGIVPLMAENFPRGAASLTVSYLALAPRPRIVKLVIKPDGGNKVEVGPDADHADRFNVHTEIGGLAGVLAPLVGKQPPDLQIWTMGKRVPLFVRLDGPLYPEGPVWTILLAAPTWPATESTGE